MYVQFIVELPYYRTTHQFIKEIKDVNKLILIMGFTVAIWSFNCYKDLLLNL